MKFPVMRMDYIQSSCWPNRYMETPKQPTLLPKLLDTLHKLKQGPITEDNTYTSH